MLPASLKGLLALSFCSLGLITHVAAVPPLSFLDQFQCQFNFISAGLVDRIPQCEDHCG